MTNPEYIMKQIEKMPDGTVFIASDLPDNTSYDNTRKIFIRLENDGKIRRILPGIYEKPLYSEILQKLVAPDPDEVAKAIARKNRWTITPSGNVALNLLGLSTQVPAKWEYYSSGDTKDYALGDSGIIISFIHRADREMADMSRKTAMVVQAIRALGKDKITEREIIILRNNTSAKEKRQLLSETRQITSWIRETIKKICTEDVNV